MSRYLRYSLAIIVLAMLVNIPSIDAYNSGKSGSTTSGCTCHSGGSGGVTPSMSGLQTSYTPGQTYSLTWTAGSPSTGQGGFNLDASLGTWTNLGNRVKTLNGELTHSSDLQRSWAADWTAPSAGSGNVVFDLAVLYANSNSGTSGDNWGTGSWTVPETVTQNTPPTVSNVYIGFSTTSGAVTQVYFDQDIFAYYDYNDDDNDVETSSQIRWSKDGNNVPQRNDFSNVPSSYTSIGEVWTLSVTPNDGTDLGNTESASNSVEIIDYDSDNDGYGDQNDAFPNDPNEHLDSDSDGVGDNADAFQNDPAETADTDGDTVGDNADAFPNDPAETTDTDNDGVGDNADWAPNDASETADSDGDNVGDNADAFPNDPAESADADGDGVGDNGDWAPNDPSETTDSDGDNVGDNADAFPSNADETVDSDGDGVGDNGDWAPNDANENSDTDADGVGDNADVFPLNGNETSDSDGDGVGDNSDWAPNDANETVDSDGDGVGDNGDWAPSDANEIADTDGDSVGDNADAFPNNAGETLDSDGDGYGDNSDVFPNNASESFDSDLDGIGDNADAFPNNANETLDSDGDGVGDNAQLIAENLAAEQAAEDEAQQQLIVVIAVVAVIIIASLGTVLFLRKRNSEDSNSNEKNFETLTLPTDNQPIQQTFQQPVTQPAMVQQPVVSEPTVLRQWTDEAGYTWRAMDDGSNYWWTGSEWQRSN